MLRVEFRRYHGIFGELPFWRIECSHIVSKRGKGICGPKISSEFDRGRYAHNGPFIEPIDFGITGLILFKSNDIKRDTTVRLNISLHTSPRFYHKRDIVSFLRDSDLGPFLVCGICHLQMPIFKHPAKILCIMVWRGSSVCLSTYCSLPL